MMMMKTNNNNNNMCMYVYILTNWTSDMKKESKIIKIKANETSFYILLLSL